MNFRIAQASDIPAIVALINLAYGGGGHAAAWTHEGTLFEADRTNEAEITTNFKTPGAVFLLGFDGNTLAASALLKFDSDSAYLGLLAVRPDIQGGGTGKQMLAEAERIALADHGCTRMTMMVIATHRPELVAFYERRGYVRTGRYGQFSRPAVREMAERIGMKLEWMEKALR